MNTSTSIYQDIAARTGGDIYIGVVGPVRTGKSTFIKRFMETLVLPRIDNVYMKERARDELPQSGSGRTIMTAEPKFVPEEAVDLELESGVRCAVRIVDCVGYMVNGASGQIEDGVERMVMTPWCENEIPMTQAAEEGTRRVITEHSSIGILVTTDGSVCGIPREDYEEAERRVANELKNVGKPFVILLNCTYPDSDSARELADSLTEEYGAKCLPVNCLELDEDGVADILKSVLYEFPVSRFSVYMPSWTDALGIENQIKKTLYDSIAQSVENVRCLRDVASMFELMQGNELVEKAALGEMQLGNGEVSIVITMPQSLYYRTISEESGFDIKDDGDLMQLLHSMSGLKSEYERVHRALESVRETGYGIVMPAPEEMRLEEPEIVRQGSRYGVRLKASAPSIHMMMANIETEVSPALGGEKASDEILNFLLQGFDGDIGRIWESNIFGKSLYDIAGESVTAKIQSLPPETQAKLQQTLQRIINEGSGGLICIIL
ncbi:MAG: stage IV sporulation protein A [Butyricicoccus sp.]|nr:stage IV sporulation protein A [Butyricicoccus sp.]